MLPSPCQEASPSMKTQAEVAQYGRAFLAGQSLSIPIGKMPYSGTQSDRVLVAQIKVFSGILWLGQETSIIMQ